MKQVIMLVASLMILVGFVSQPVFASTGEARAAICMVCNKGIMVSTTSNSAWVVYKEEKCIHHTYGYDIIYSRIAITTTTCNVCGQGYNSSTTEYKTVCNGSDTP